MADVIWCSCKTDFLDQSRSTRKTIGRIIEQKVTNIKEYCLVPKHAPSFQYSFWWKRKNTETINSVPRCKTVSKIWPGWKNTEK
jgi:hypothetical protein